MLSKYIKYFLITFFSLTFVLNNNVLSKPLPPGSGEGDVPANILIILDTSASMSGSTFTGDAIDIPRGLILLNDDDVIVGLSNKGGVVKFDTDSANEELDSNFAGGSKVYRGHKNGTCLTQTGKRNTRIYTSSIMGKATSVKDYAGVNDNNGDNTTEVIYVADETTDGGRVVGLSADGQCVEAIQGATLGFSPRSLTTRRIGTEDFLLVSGRSRTCTKWKGRGHKRRCKRWSSVSGFYSKNLTENTAINCTVNRAPLNSYIQHTYAITMDDGNNLFLQKGGSIYKFPLEKIGNHYCPRPEAPTQYDTANGSTDMKAATYIGVDPEDDSIIYLTSYLEHGLQKLTIGTKVLTQVEWIGGEADSEETPAGATGDSTLVKFFNPAALYVGNDRVWTGGSKNSIQEFNITGDIAWVNEMGSTRMNRFTGAKKAIKAVVENSGLLSGANFGFGYFNAGRVKSIRTGPKKLRKWCRTCEKTCHTECPATGKRLRCNDNCDYFDGWTGGANHKTGRSSLCNHHSCLKVPIKERNTKAIVDSLRRLRLEFGTDANAFSQIAYRYFNETDILADNLSDCQLNYVIVIGDGMWTHHDEAREDIKDLRELGVTTLFVAYGSGIRTAGLNKFKRMAITGSCDEPDATATDYDNAIATNPECERVIEAPDPKSLLTKLESKIQQIVASRLSFTAPSITATLQEGGHLYQAQFAYVQHGEWQGKIVKKKLSSDGVVDHENIVWNTDDTVKAQAVLGENHDEGRKIWTILPESDYWGNWNNIKTANKGKISGLFNLLGHTVADFHNATSNCGPNATPTVTPVVSTDDVEGLINFIRGQDYFDYDGDCKITEYRDSVLGDIYHSQLVEVGPPNANTNFTGSNQEAYYRAKNGYDSFAKNKMTRDRIIYAGGNDGMLHAFRASDGKEAWAFMPPFITAKIPTTSIEALSGVFKDVGTYGAGGSNPIFGVDGSPVIHDVYLQGLAEDGTIEDGPSWHTYLIIPYGRGGNGFSVLDVTNPLVEPSKGPLHVFSIYNDKDNGRVWVADHNGNITPRNYDTKTFTIRESLEAQQAVRNNAFAKNNDTDDDETNQEAIVDCQSNFDAASGSFRTDGTNACYYGNTFTFEFQATDEQIADPSKLKIFDSQLSKYIVANTVTINDEGYTVVDFCAPGSGVAATTLITDAEATACIKIFNDSNVEGSQLIDDFFTVETAHKGTDEKQYDYSLLGETWSTPRVFRLPDEESESIDDDEYVFVMGGGFGTSRGVGSNVFIVSLENLDEPGQIVGYEENDGPIKIVDIDNSLPCGKLPGEVCFEDIHNSVPGDLIVITPDQFKGVKWRGAMVYASDIEGKITKINLTNMPDNGKKTDAAKQSVKLYDQTTLFSLNTNEKNSRFLYHGMDAALGRDTNNLWLFGGTGDFTNIGEEQKGMDNILFGVRDEHFPYFQHLNGTVPEGDAADFEDSAKNIAQAAPIIDNDDECSNNSDGTTDECPGDVGKKAWVYQLDKPYDKNDDIDPKFNTGDVTDEEAQQLLYTQNRYRKASASPTVYKGNVYFPIYEPPIGQNKCNIGKAFICSADDECGINNSSDIGYRKQGNFDESGFDPNANCYFVRKGVLSKLVVFGDTLFANIATEGEQKDTLVQILSGIGEIDLYRGKWRENF